jgi:flagellum-specific peptidoglycan hydrolase FlgJ
MRRSASASEQEAFVSEFADFAHDLSQVTGVRPEVILGQASLESNWGKNAPGNNMFGVKGAYEGKSQRLSTTEVINGHRSRVKDDFRVYPDKLTSMKDWSKVIAGKAYDNVRKGKTVEEQVAALAKSPYATEDDNKICEGPREPDLGYHVFARVRTGSEELPDGPHQQSGWGA